ncbi:MAG TPA: potassium-transporting ATPase subunit KdpA, partial [Iamia sp.]|nr:potassium-transporting ATPase subunit KdpA [Iamia sp.]
MAAPALVQLLVLVLLIVVAMGPLGRYMAAVYGAGDDGSAPGDRIFGPVERVVYRAARVDPD